MRTPLWTATGVVVAAVVVSVLALRNDTDRAPVETTVVSVDSGAATEPAPGDDGHTSALEEPTVASAAAVATRPPWDALYREATDYFAFVQAAAPAAIAGDGRAQWYLYRVLLTCELHVKTSKIRAEERPPYAPPGTGWRARRCDAFIGASPLEAFDLPDAANSFAYWRDQARAAGDALALTARAVSTAAQVDFDTDAATKADLHRRILDDVRAAIASQEPEALLYVGGLYMSPALSREPVLQSAAWIVAACELGYDCAQPFPGIAELCAESGMCTNMQTVSDFIQTAPDFARIYTAGQDIAYKIRARDWAGLEPYLEMRP